MGLNSIVTSNIISMSQTLENRANNLEAMIQGSPINNIRINDAIIITAKIDDLSITTAKIDTGAIINAKIDSLSAVKITAGTINADRIAADSIVADKLDVSTLSAISANFGNLTAGSVTGLVITSSLFRTSSGDDRVQIANVNRLLFYEDGDLRNWIREDLFYVYPGTGSGSSGIGFFELGGSGAFRGVTGLSSDEQTFVYGTSNCPLLLFQALGNNDTEVFAQGGTVHFFCDDFQINGSSKSAIVPTSKGYNALYCVESPEVWFFDIVDSIDNIDKMFIEVTEGKMKTITNNKNEIIVFRKRKGFKDVRFESKTDKQFIKNNRFWSQQN